MTHSRRCYQCGTTYQPKRSNQRYCTPNCRHVNAMRRGHRFATIPKPSNTARGYGTAHMKARRTAATHHHPTDPCARCHQPLGPMRPTLHYDHNGQRTGYLGFSHARCNVKAAAQTGQARSHPHITPLAL